MKIIKDELNVKEIIMDREKKEEMVLDTTISEELKLEGQARETVRFIQEMRKVAGYEVDNRIRVGYAGADEAFGKFRDMIAKEVLADEMKAEKLIEFDLEKDFLIDGKKLLIRIKK